MTQFKPGQSGNPGGRTPGFARAVRQICGEDPIELAKIAYEIATGKLRIGGKPATFNQRLWAIELLRDSGWGKPVQAVDARVTNAGGIVVALPPIAEDTGAGK